MWSVTDSRESCVFSRAKPVYNIVTGFWQPGAGDYREIAPVRFTTSTACLFLQQQHRLHDMAVVLWHGISTRSLPPVAAAVPVWVILKWHRISGVPVSYLNKTVQRFCNGHTYCDISAVIWPTALLPVPFQHNTCASFWLMILTAIVI